MFRSPFWRDDSFKAGGARRVAACWLVALAAFGLGVLPTRAQTADPPKAKTANSKATKSQTKKAVAAPAVSASAAPEAPKADDTDSLRKAAQNPIANLISVPLQNNTNFDVGPYHRPQNVLNFQPVIPIHITEDWNLITRWITPVIYQPRLSPTEGAEFGLGNLSPAFFLSPANSGEIIWGVGAQTWLPTATDKTLGVNKWGAGPAAVALTMQGQWVYGALVNNVWAGTANQRVNTLTLQPFVNYNLPKGWYLTSSPILTSNWLADSGDRWTVPVGGGFGRLFKVDKLPINMQLQAFYNVVRPTNAPSWTLRFQIQALFPTI
jgi:hypothetical protein